MLRGIRGAVLWLAAAAAAAAATAAAVRLSPGDAETTMRLTPAPGQGATEEIILTGLKNEQEYILTVVAESNGEGDGPAPPFGVEIGLDAEHGTSNFCQWLSAPYPQPRVAPAGGSASLLFSAGGSSSRRATAAIFLPLPAAAGRAEGPVKTTFRLQPAKLEAAGLAAAAGPAAVGPAGATQQSAVAVPPAPWPPADAVWGPTAEDPAERPASQPAPSGEPYHAVPAPGAAAPAPLPRGFFDLPTAAPRRGLRHPGRASEKREADQVLEIRSTGATASPPSDDEGLLRAPGSGEGAGDDEWLLTVMPPALPAAAADVGAELPGFRDDGAGADSAGGAAAGAAVGGATVAGAAPCTLFESPASSSALLATLFANFPPAGESLVVTPAGVGAAAQASAPTPRLEVRELPLVLQARPKYPMALVYTVDPGSPAPFVAGASGALLSFSLPPLAQIAALLRERAPEAAAAARLFNIKIVAPAAAAQLLLSPPGPDPPSFVFQFRPLRAAQPFRLADSEAAARTHPEFAFYPAGDKVHFFMLHPGVPGGEKAPRRSLDFELVVTAVVPNGGRGGSTAAADAADGAAADDGGSPLAPLWLRATLTGGLCGAILTLFTAVVWYVAEPGQFVGFLRRVPGLHALPCWARFTWFLEGRPPPPAHPAAAAADLGEAGEYGGAGGEFHVATPPTAGTSGKEFQMTLLNSSMEPFDETTH